MRKLQIAYAFCLLLSCCVGSPKPPASVQISAAALEDKIQGGFLGQLLGNLNGLPHEGKYIDEPGQVENYVPGLPEGARSDDDTDIEWIYIVAMQRANKLVLSQEEIARCWKEHINERVWCSNWYARHLMDLGIEPPLTGRIALNPWAAFNISGQFVCESFGLISPGMPQSAARTGLHYTHVAIDGEPAQATQLFTTMIAAAFFENDVETIVNAGLIAVDPSSEIHQIVRYVLRSWKQNPGDWRKTRRQIKDTYTRYDGAMRDRNGYELNTASTVAALLYGGGDFVETLRLAFCFGWDADNNAATCGTVAGVMKGRAWIAEQGWDIQDRYRNVSREGMPMDETISSFGNRLVRLARKNILEHGGELQERGGEGYYSIAVQTPSNVEPLPHPLNRWDELKHQLVPVLHKEIEGTGIQQARAAYYAICLDEAVSMRSERPDTWNRALRELSRFPAVIRNLYGAPGPYGDRLRELAEAAGLDRVAAGN